MNNVCPNGFICINHLNAILIVIFAISGMYIYNNENYKKLFSNYQQLQQTKNQIVAETNLVIARTEQVDYFAKVQRYIIPALIVLVVTGVGAYFLKKYK